LAGRLGNGEGTTAGGFFTFFGLLRGGTADFVEVAEEEDGGCFGACFLDDVGTTDLNTDLEGGGGGFMEVLLDKVEDEGCTVVEVRDCDKISIIGEVATSCKDCSMLLLRIAFSLLVISSSCKPEISSYVLESSRVASPSGSKIGASPAASLANKTSLSCNRVVSV